MVEKHNNEDGSESASVDRVAGNWIWSGASKIQKNKCMLIV